MAVIYLELGELGVVGDLFSLSRTPIRALRGEPSVDLVSPVIRLSRQHPSSVSLFTCPCL